MLSNNLRKNGLRLRHNRFNRKIDSAPEAQNEIRSGNEMLSITGAHEA
jgi:hypothetical protein